jgi:hypothetical protein
MHMKIDVYSHLITDSVHGARVWTTPAPRAPARPPGREWSAPGAERGEGASGEGRAPAPGESAAPTEDTAFG